MLHTDAKVLDFIFHQFRSTLWLSVTNLLTFWLSAFIVMSQKVGDKIVPFCLNLSMLSKDKIHIVLVLPTFFKEIMLEFYRPFFCMHKDACC